MSFHSIKQYTHRMEVVSCRELSPRVAVVVFGVHNTWSACVMNVAIIEIPGLLVLWPPFRASHRHVRATCATTFNHPNYTCTTDKRLASGLIKTRHCYGHHLLLNKYPGFPGQEHSRMYAFVQDMSGCPGYQPISARLIRMPHIRQ